MYAGENTDGWVSFGGIIFLVSKNRGRETTHQKEAKNDRMLPRKRTKAREKRKRCVNYYECEKSALLANFFILILARVLFLL